MFGKDLKKIGKNLIGKKIRMKVINNKEINDLINVLKDNLKDTIKDVRISERLTKSPLLLIADESGLDINMEKIMKIHNKSFQNNKKILEINPNHLMIKKLSNSLTKLDHKKISNLFKKIEKINFSKISILRKNPIIVFEKNVI